MEAQTALLTSGCKKNEIIHFKPMRPFHEGWNKISGLMVSEDTLTIDPDVYFIRLEQKSWTYIPWETVQSSWEEIAETTDTALEQAALSFIAKHRQITDNPAVVLENAEKVYSFLFDQDKLATYDDLHDVSADDLRVLRESSILCSLNKVGLDGRITIIGPAWYFAQCAKKVFDLDRASEMRVDELFHGGFFNGARLADQVKAHIALGGKLVHGCQGTGNGSGGCVVEYGTDLKKLQSELIALRDPIVTALGTHD